MTRMRDGRSAAVRYGPFEAFEEALAIHGLLGSR